MFRGSEGKEALRAVGLARGAFFWVRHRTWDVTFCVLLSTFSTIQWTANAHRPLVEDMGVDHGGADIFVAKQFLNGADIVAVF